jgi:hypothetical protein
MRDALDPAPASPKSETKTKEGEGQNVGRSGVHTDFGAVVDAIR